MSEPLADRPSPLAHSLEEALALLEEPQHHPGPQGAWADARRIVESFLQARAERLFESARETLFQRARSAPSYLAQAEYFDAMQEVVQVRDQVRGALLAGVLDPLARLAAAAPPVAPEEEGGPLSLVDTQSLTDIVAVQNILQRRVPELAGGLHALGDAIAGLAGKPVTPVDNPLGPHAVCHAFRDALQHLGVGGATREALFRAFDGELVVHLGELYQRLGARLAGLAPGSPAPAPRAAACLRSESQPAGSGRPPAPGAAAGLQAGKAGPVQSTGRGPAAQPAPANGPPAPLPVGASEAYRALQALAGTLAGPGRGSGLPAPTGEGATGFVGRLIASVLADPLVTAGTRPRVAALAPALTRLALRDASLLHDEHHPARRWLNALARIALPELPEIGSFEAELAAQVDQVVRQVVTWIGDDGQVFGASLGSIESLADRQSERYARRVAAVVGALRADAVLAPQGQAPAQGAGAGAGDHGAPPAAAPDPLAQSLGLVAGLRLGDYLGFSRRGELQAEALAWMDERRVRFVFVDRFGMRSSTLGGRELATLLQAGDARLLPGVRLPPIERGIYAVFQELQDKVTYDATHDPVTSLPNQKTFQARLRDALRAEPAPAGGQAVLYVELDQMEAVATQLGPALVDALLARYAHVLDKHFGQRGVLGYLGGHAFAVLLQGCSGEAAVPYADRHRYSVYQSQVKWQGRSLAITVSVGVADALSDGSRAEDLLQAAQIACRKAQKDGGNRTVPYRAGLAHLVARDRIDWSRAVPRTLEENQLVLFRQRIEPLRPEARVGPHYEILLRLKGAAGETLPPHAFIAGAERSGLMAQVDRWVVGHTLDWLARHRAELDAVSGYAVNLSGQTLSDEGLADHVLRAFERTGIPPEKVLFEVTETAAIAQLGVATEFIKRLKALGCRFCLDDFGTGQATYSYLKLLPVDYVKIDGMFVKDIAVSPSDLAMVRSINEVSHFMGRKTIAEFVESAEILALLREVGVDYAQGYGIHQPAALPD